MPNVPHIVRQRLKAATSDVAHPDPDMLNAFAERSLSVLERDAVLEHIARCGDCREVLALALPATEALQLVVKPSVGWMTWPALRWGFVAAGIVLVGSLGVVQYQRHQTLALTTASKSVAPSEVAKNEPHPLPPVPAASNSATTPVERDKSSSSPRATLDSSNSAADESKDALKFEPKRMAPARIPEGSGGVAGAMGSPTRLRADATLNQQQKESQNSFHGQAFTPTSPTVFAKQRAAAGNSPASQVAVQSESAQVDSDQSALPAAAGASANYSESSIGKAKPAVTGQSSDAAAAPNTLNPLPLQTQPGLLRAYAAPLPRWTISASGGLQRSYDSGKTWQDVDVNAIPVLSAETLSLVATGPAPDNKTEKDSNPSVNRQAARAGRREAAPTIFRAVTATGADVWAGGSFGALYHSRDAGLHWTRVLPVSANAVLTGDVVTLEFPDAQHGKLTTSTSEVWTTSDAGQSWQKQ